MVMISHIILGKLADRFVRIQKSFLRHPLEFGHLPLLLPLLPTPPEFVGQKEQQQEQQEQVAGNDEAV